MIDRALVIKLKPLLDSPLWEGVERILDGYLRGIDNVLDTADGGPVLYRAQGKKQIINELKSLRGIAREIRGLEIE